MRGASTWLYGLSLMALTEASCVSYPVGSWSEEIACDDGFSWIADTGTLRLRTYRRRSLRGEGLLNGVRLYPDTGETVEYGMAFSVLEVVEVEAESWETLIGDCVDASIEPGGDRFFCNEILCEETVEALSVEFSFIYQPG
ncbi:MAG: hypothetical protein H6739_18430 [Alphaproteobacteria bacterium]|nr:hypothetical protein [Alphaproteobacteria bacterium]